MELPIIIALCAVVSLVVGLASGNLYYKRKLKKNEDSAHDKAKLILKEAEIQAETLKKDKILEAKEKLLKMKQEFEEEANRKKNQIISNEQKIKQREGQLAKEIEQIKRKESELDEERQSLAQQHDLVKKRKEELDKFNAQNVVILEAISTLPSDHARDHL